MDRSKWSDGQLNEAVAIALGWKWCGVGNPPRCRALLPVTEDDADKYGTMWPMPETLDLSLPVAGDQSRILPSWSSDIDAAMGLLCGLTFVLAHDLPTDPYECGIGRKESEQNQGWSMAATPARAIALAFLAAHDAKGGA